MSVKSFKFVSPGVFIHEIDNSFIPRTSPVIGPVVIGRASRGLAMQPVKVESYSAFVEMFGDTVPGGGTAGGDVYRDGNYQSPMYGTYAAKAFLNANVAPLTYVRLLGQQDANATSAGYAGWKTEKVPATTIAENGGAYGLWVWPSSSASPSSSIGDGALAAVWYLDQAATIILSGTLITTDVTTGAIGAVIATDSNNLFTTVISSSNGSKKTKFGFDDSAETWLRNRFNTNPQLASTAGTFYPSTAYKAYWLGESYEQELRDGNVGTGSLTGGGTSLVGVAAHGVILPIAKTSDTSVGPANMKNQASREGVAGWFISQDLEAPASYAPDRMQKLFRLKGRGHGEWLQRNVKVSIESIKQSTSTVSDYGTFDVVIRSMSDTDSNVVVIERFDTLSLDPTSPNFIARKIGDQYYAWDSNSKRLKLYGEYPNQSKFVYVHMNSDVEGGATDARYLPFGYYGPPRFSDAIAVTSSLTSTFIVSPLALVNGNDATYVLSTNFRTGSAADGNESVHGLSSSFVGGTLTFPEVRLRLSASDGGLSDPTSACFGFQATRGATSTRHDASTVGPQRLLYADFPNDPTTYGTAAVIKEPSALAGVMSYGYIFSLDDVKYDSTSGGYMWQSGSRAAETSLGSGSYTEVLNAGYNRFTAPIWGAFDGFDIKLPDPLYNAGMASGTERTSSPYATYRRAIDTVADPEFLDMNLLAVPGLTLDALTTHMVNVCEDRADALALIDLANIYIPDHEAYKSDKKNRIGTTPTSAANNLRSRRVDSSYGCTFYPWVQTTDENTGRLLWVPPSVAMMGVLASSQANSDAMWFAPAGFNRGGLSEGAAGIPISQVTERLTSKQRDTLYEARINPIASFPNTGIVVFGQKTLQERQSALDRINVRRLVIYLKKQISILATQVLFEQNVQATWTRFRGLIDPFLANVKVNFGITDYKLILDESTTTPDLIDQNVLYAKIMVKPARAIEYIAIDFVIASTGASFED